MSEGVYINGVSTLRINGSRNLNGGKIAQYEDEIERTANTFKNMTEAQEIALYDTESRIRHNYDHEEGYLVKPDGTLIKGKGEQKQVSFTMQQFKEAGRNAILTHNHPYYDGRGIKSIGHAFSDQDLRTAYENGVKGVRVVTGRYTFSMTRVPGKSRQISMEQFDSYSKAAEQHCRDKYDEYLKKHKQTARTDQWYSIMFEHEYSKYMSKVLGWEYTRSMDMSTKTSPKGKVKRSRLAQMQKRHKAKNAPAISKFA